MLSSNQLLHKCTYACTQYCFYSWMCSCEWKHTKHTVHLSWRRWLPLYMRNVSFPESWPPSLLCWWWANKANKCRSEKHGRAGEWRGTDKSGFLFLNKDRTTWSIWPNWNANQIFLCWQHSSHMTFRNWLSSINLASPWAPSMLPSPHTTLKISREIFG